MRVIPWVSYNLSNQYPKPWLEVDLLPKWVSPFIGLALAKHFHREKNVCFTLLTATQNAPWNTAAREHFGMQWESVDEKAASMDGEAHENTLLNPRIWFHLVYKYAHSGLIFFCAPAMPLYSPQLQKYLARGKVLKLIFVDTKQDLSDCGPSPGSTN